MLNSFLRVEEKLMTITTLLLITLFCSSGYGFGDCPYSSGNEPQSSTTCNGNVYDCNVFNEKILDYEQKLKPVFEKVKSKQSLSATEIEVATKIVNEYYTYLMNKNIFYGELARDVVNDHGAFAKLANSHLKHRAEVEGKSDQIENIENNLRVALAYSDAKLRSECTQAVPYKAIADYHYEMFELQGLSKYAWGGTLLEEFAGSGSWMNIGGYDKKVDFTFMNLMKALISNKQVNDIKARDALNSIKHLPLENLGDSLLASTYRILITYEPIYEEVKKHHNSFFAPDGHVYNFEEYKTEVLDKMFEQHPNQKQMHKENSDEHDHTENDDKEDFSNPELNIKFVKAANLGSTRVVKQIAKRLKNGNIVVMWCTHEDAEYSNMKTSLQIHSEVGNKLKSPLEISFTSFNLNLEPLSDGGFIVYSTDIFNIHNANADLMINGRFTPCFVNYKCYRQHVTAMKDNQFLLTWHQRTEVEGKYFNMNTVTFKGQYYNSRGNTTSEEFTIYHGTENTWCKLSSIDDDFVGVICNDRGSTDETLNDAATDFLACVDHVPQSVTCYTTMSTISKEKNRWKKLPASYNSEPLEILNMGHHNFVVLIEQVITGVQKIDVIVLNNDVIQNTIKIENQLDKKYEILLTKLTGESFLITWRSYDGHNVQGFKYNINGLMISEEISIVTRGSNHHFETYADDFGFVMNWLNSKHKCNEIQKWHHFEHGYSGAWSNSEELNTTIFMLIKNNYILYRIYRIHNKLVEFYVYYDKEQLFEYRIYKIHNKFVALFILNMKQMRLNKMYQS